ncbi:MAG: hypothetical protein BECKG1743D_GA0114223_102733 [Candidatus Kentron sp. G]|nr:MAG: hypothetical protein BECKG1743F_GA0114225_102803 [Candidatus Kentron sp. G]VFM99517.1 MAG: hypothetical protein BECKG1743E_GA0114224_102626 [Candidatus Kentron sp. G]VFN01364.1 MAG: hypothetical protein BECKG1743D_GA0114223_102733 [Candidatus Kentron sp. G]
MEWIVGIVVLIVGFLLDRAYEWHKKRKIGLTGQAHDIIAKLGDSVQSYTGNYFLSDNPTDNFRITRHLYEHATGDVIGTCFRENPVCYGEQDLARLLPKGASFTRLTTEGICPDADRIQAEATLKELAPNAKIVGVPSGDYFTRIDGIFTELSDGTHIAFVTFPKTGTEDHNRGIVFYGHTARAFFEYYRDLRDASRSVLEKQTA